MDIPNNPEQSAKNNTLDRIHFEEHLNVLHQKGHHLAEFGHYNGCDAIYQLRISLQEAHNKYLDSMIVTCRTVKGVITRSPILRVIIRTTILWVII